MRTISNPNRFSLLYTRKFCSDINLLTRNIVGELPGDYKNQLKVSVGNLMPLGQTLDTKQKQVLAKCRDQLLMKGEEELSGDISRLLI